MFFKKKKIAKSPKISYNKIITGTIGVFLALVIFSVGVVITSKINSIQFNLFSGNILGGATENTGKDDEATEDQKTNILIIGRGGGNHDAPDLTDTLILASIKKDSPSIVMLSIPRDLYVEYADRTTGKINEIFQRTMQKYNNRNAGIEALKDKITEITGEEIDFYVDVDFTGFIKTVDAVGGVTVSLENTFVDYEFPDEETGEYTTFVLRKGTWTLDGDVALKYARSRHSTSDFDRSQRQQEILASLKQRLIDNGYLSNPLKIKELFGILNDYVRTDLGLVDIIKLASQLQGTEQQIRSFHLNDTCFYGSETCSVGGILYVPERQLFNNLSVLLIEGTDINNLSNYTLSQRFADRIFNKTSIFEKNHTINIFNATKTKFLARSMADSLKKRGFNIPEKDSLGNVRDEVFTENTIFYNGIEEDDTTLQEILSLFPGFVAIQTEAPKYSENPDTTIEIVIALDSEDYEI